MRPDELGAALRRLRLERGWALSDLARRAGTSAPAVHRYEAGWRRFEIATLTKLAAALGRRVDIRLVPPPRTPLERSSAGRLVDRLRRLFWDRPLETRDLRRHPSWIVQRVLELGSLDDVRSLARYYGRSAFLSLVQGVRFESPRTRAFWDAMLGEEGRTCTRKYSRREADACWMP
jgi:transcriptional regulator with XRE-family HTH domain